MDIRAQHRWRAVLGAVALWLVLPGVLLTADGQDTDWAAVSADHVKLLEGLRQRRMFELAAAYCQRELSSADLQPPLPAILTVELIRTQTAEAAFTDKSQRQALWLAADQTADNFLKREDQPRAILVRVQQALANVVRADLLNQELAAEMIDPTERESALEQLRVARSRLEEIRQLIAREIPLRNARALDPGELTVPELMSLNDSVGFQLARCNLVRAQLYQRTGAGKADRSDALNQALSRLDEVGRSVAPGRPLWWQVKLAQVQAYRLAEEIELAKPLMEELLQREPPANLVSERLEQQLRLAAAAGDDVALQQALGQLSEAQPATASLELAALEAVVQLANSGSTPAQKQRWIELASELTRQMEQKHGGYWGRRAELALIRSLGETAGNPDRDPGNVTMSASAEVDLLIRTAADAQRKGRLDDALQAYDRAKATAQQQGNRAVVQSLQIRASQVLEELGNHLDAGNRLIDAAQWSPGSEVAGQAHLRGCWNYAQVLAAQNQPAARQTAQQRLIEALSDHLKRFSKSPTSDQAAFWLAGQYRQRRQFAAAVDALLTIDPASPSAQEAVNQARQCIGLAASQGDRFADLIDRLRVFADGTVEASPIQRQVELAVAELEFQLAGRKPDGRLAAALGDDSAFDETSSMLSAVSLSTTNVDRSLEFIQQVKDLSTLDRAFLLSESILKNGSMDPGEVKALRRLQQQVVSQVLAQPDGVDENVRDGWRFREARLAAAQGRYDKAIELLAALEKQFPNQADIKIQLASALTAKAESQPSSASDERWQAALNAWRLIAARSRKHTDPWFESKFQVARILNLQGDSEEAVKLLKYLKAVPPGWENAARKSDFEALLNRLGGE